MTAAAPSANGLGIADTLRRAIHVVRRGSTEGFEIRVLGIARDRGKSHEAAGYFRDEETAVDAVIAVAKRRPAGIYITVNPVDSLCHARSPDVITDYQEPTTSDRDITRRLWLFLDFDPKRPAGVAATIDQVAAARRHAEAAWNMMREEFGWPDPAMIDSGNGCYLLYAVDLPNDEETKKLFKAVIESLAGIFDFQEPGEPIIKLDSTGFNAARIMRLAGTWNRKGHSTETQAHRQSGIISCPEEVQLVTVEQLRELTSQKTTANNSPTPPNDTGHRLRVPDWLGDRGITIKRTGRTSEGWEAWWVDCPFDGSHGAHGEVYFAQSDRGGLVFKCHHDSCSMNRWQQAKERIGAPEGNHYDPPILKGPKIGEGKQTSANGATGGTTDASAKPQPFSLEVIDSAAFDAADYRPEFFIKGIFVKKQPRAIGGTQKVLKTTIACDEAISIASGTAFLGVFAVPRPARVLMISGESGPFSLQEISRRVCAAKGIELRSLPLFWGHKIPQLANPEHMDVLKETIQRLKIEAVYIDPLYLSLLSGPWAQNVAASNVFQMGPLLLNIAQACLEVGCTPTLIHHSSRGSENQKRFEPLELGDLAFAGLPEFCRQWLLLSRREKYEPGSGLHRLWVVAGGSIGHGGCWAADIDEGRLNDDFHGRIWNVNIDTATENRKAASEAQGQKKETKAAQTVIDAGTRLLVALDKVDPKRQGVSKTKVRDVAGLGNPMMTRVVVNLVETGVIEELSVNVAIGSNATRLCEGIRRKPIEDAQSTIGTIGKPSGFNLCPDGDHTISTAPPPLGGAVADGHGHGAETVQKESETCPDGQTTAPSAKKAKRPGKGKAARW